jgi:hypothetical protein
VLISAPFRISTRAIDTNWTINQLKPAVAIKEKIASLNDELRIMFGEPSESDAVPTKKAPHERCRAKNAADKRETGKAPS